MNDDLQNQAAKALCELSGASRVQFFEPENTGLRNACMAAIDETGFRRVITTFANDAVFQAENIDVNFVSVTDENGTFVPEQLLEELRTPSAAVIVPLADAETGLVFPIGSIAAAVKQGSDALLLVDISAAAGKIPIDRAEIGDMLFLSANGISSLLFGGERNITVGSTNVDPNKLSAFTDSIGKAADQLSEMPRLAAIRGRTERKILDTIPRSRLNTTADPQKRLPNISNISFENTNGESLAAMLAESGFFVTTGSACAGPKHEPSSMLRSLNVPYSFAMGSIRIEFPPEWDDETAMRFSSETERIVKKLRSYG